MKYFDRIVSQEKLLLCQRSKAGDALAADASAFEPK